uniref:Ribonuclease HII n=1 Tax=Panagrellus redivivus TaxID=6233 RepID=A0A7E4W7E5_PANRE
MKPQMSNPVDRFRKIIPPCRYYKPKLPIDKALQKLDIFYSHRYASKMADDACHASKMADDARVPCQQDGQ